MDKRHSAKMEESLAQPKPLEERRHVMLLAAERVTDPDSLKEVLDMLGVFDPDIYEQPTGEEDEH